MKATYFIWTFLFINSLLYGQADLAEAIQVNSDLGSDLALKQNPKAIANDDGIVAVIWEDERNGLNELYLQLIDDRQRMVGSNLNLSSSYKVERDQYDLTALSNGNFLVSWSGTISSSDNVYFTIIDPEGEVVLENQLVPKAENISNNAFPAVAALGDNRFVLGFVEDDFSDPAVRAQLYDYDGQAIGDRLLIESLPRGDDALNIDIAVNNSKEILVVYQREVSFRDYNIAAVVLDENLQLQSTNLKINEVEEEGKNPSAIALSDGNFAIFWLDTRASSRGNTYGQKLTPSAEPTGPQRALVSTSSGTVITNRYPRVLRLGDRIGVSNARSSTAITLVDEDLDLIQNDQYEGVLPFPVAVNNEIGAVHLQGIVSNFTVGGSEKVILQIEDDQTRINNDQNSFSESIRELAFSPEGNGVVIWDDLRNGKQYGFAQRIAPDNTLLGDPITIPRERSSSYEIAIAKDGSFAIYFAEIANFQTTWVIQFYDAEGNLLRRRKLGTEDGTANIAEFQGIEYNPEQNNYVVWSRENASNNSTNSVLRVWTYDVDGENRSDKKTLFDREAQSIFRWAVREDGNFVVAFMDFSNGFNDLDAYWAVVSPR
ncbi:MAG: hypothetical protein AAF242_15090, partial [Bacteroidota bacterium]